MSIPSTPVAHEGYQDVNFIPATPRLGVKNVYLLGRRKSVFKPIPGTMIDKTVSLSAIKQPYIKYLVDFNLCCENFANPIDFDLPLPETLDEQLELIFALDYLQDDYCLSYALRSVALRDPDLDKLKGLAEHLKLEIFMYLSPVFVLKHLEELEEYLPQIISLRHHLSPQEIERLLDTKNYSNSMHFKNFTATALPNPFKEGLFTLEGGDFSILKNRNLVSLFAELSLMSLVSNVDPPLSAAPFTDYSSFSTTMQLSSLDLVHNKIITDKLSSGAKQVAELAELIELFGSCISKAIIYHKNPDQAATLAYFVLLRTKYLPALSELDLSKNSFEFPHIYKISEALNEINNNLTFLDLSQNDIRVDSLMCLGSCFQEVAIEGVSLAHNPLCSSGASSLAEFISNGVTFKNLNISYCAIGDIGAKDLAKALEKNQTIQELDISVNNVSDFGFSALADCLTINKTLLKLKAFNQKLSSLGIAKLKGSLDQNSTLEYLGISLDSTDDATKEWFKNRFKLDQRLIEKAELYSVDAVTSQFWFLISEKFLYAWRDFIDKDGPRPLTIDNTCLVDEKGKPKPNLISGVDYRGLHPTVWTKLFKIYKGGPPIVRSELDIYSPAVMYPFGGSDTQDLAIDKEQRPKTVIDVIPEPSEESFISPSPLIMQTK